MKIDEQRYDAIAREIHSDSSPVGIDAKKTHILIIQMLQDIEARLNNLEQRIESLVPPPASQTVDPRGL